MATSLLALIDDVASILDDVAILTKVAAKKTSGVIGDDLALNAQQMNGINPDKELPIIFAVAKGALVNKAILVPIAMLISFFMPSLISPLLMIGGAFLCFEGVEKILEKFLHKHDPSAVKPVVSEEEKIKGAIRTDFILSAEIIVISLGSIGHGTLLGKTLALAAISILMTVGVYGLVALIIKLDDMGLYLYKSKYKVNQKFGYLLINSAPVLMKILGVVGTAAMFLVGGGIIAHGIPAIGHLMDNIQFGHALTKELVGLGYEGFLGVITGLVVVGVVLTVKSVKMKIKS